MSSDDPSVPLLEAQWARQLLGGALPSEPLATCDACVMVARPEEAPQAFSPCGAFFHPSTKCCTYWPALPSFLVGRLLADPDPQLEEGRQRIRRRIRCRADVTPMGIRPSWTHDALYRRDSDRFGRSLALRCPYLGDAGRCSIWSHRGAVCATWFCKHARGATGQRFWKSLERLMVSAERALARWCLLELDVGEAALRSILGSDAGAGAEDDVDVADDAAYRVRWGPWLGREEELYVEAARRVEELSWAEVERIGGSEVAVMAALARHAYRAVRTEVLPAAVEVGHFTVVAATAHAVRVRTYSSYNPIDLPLELLEVVPRLAAGTLASRRELVARELGFELDDALVQKLLDFEILEPAG